MLIDTSKFFKDLSQKKNGRLFKTLLRGGKLLFFLTLFSTCSLNTWIQGQSFIAPGRLLYANRLFSGYRINYVAWSPNGQFLSTANGTGDVWVLHADTGSRAYIYPSQNCTIPPESGVPNSGCWINTVAWSADGTRLASGGREGVVEVWDALNGEHPLIYRGHTQAVWTVAWSPNGKYLASAGAEGVVHVWDAESGKKIFTFDDHSEDRNKGVWSLAWSPDSDRLASANKKGEIFVWNAYDGGGLKVYRRHLDDVFEVSWSPNGQYIASASGDGTVHVWSPSTGILLFLYRDHSRPMTIAHPVTTVAWSPDSKLIASAGEDSTVRIWNAQDGSTSFIYRGHNSVVRRAVWSPDGSRIASVAEDGTLQVWLATGCYVDWQACPRPIP